MFKDTKKEMERLEAELLAQEEPEEELEEEEDWEEDEDALLRDDDDIGEDTVYRNFSNHYRAYNSDRADWDPEELSEELNRPKKSGVWGLCAVVLLLVAGIFLLLAWWLLQRNGGFL